MRKFLPIIALVLVCTDAYAAKVLKVDKNQTMMAVSHTQVRRWRLGDYLCVLHQDEEVACGAAIKITSRGAIVRFDYRSGELIKPGDEVQFYASEADVDHDEKDAAPPPPSPAPAPEGEAEATGPQATAPQVTGPTVPLPDKAPEKVAEKTERAERTVTPPSPPTPNIPKGASTPTKEEEEWIDLDSLDEVPAESPASSKIAEAHGGPHPKTSSKPRFRVMYDWLLTYRPGTDPNWTFDSYHNLLMMEFYPTREIYFGFEVSPNPRFFELDYQLSKRLTFRIGKIYVPFDDLSPHSYFGGRANINKLVPGNGNSFLPDLWTDMGMGLHWAAYTDRLFTIDAQVYVVNGFGEGAGINPLDPTALYPEFKNTAPVQDNNKDKAIGLRVSGNFLGDMLGFGISAYRGRYSDQLNPSAFVHMVGADAQFRVKGFEARSGYVFMLVDIPDQDPATYRRGGLYAEIGQSLGKKNQFKILARAGAVNHDSRAILATDQIIVGGQMVYRFGGVSVGVEHSIDVNNLPNKGDNSFTGLRISVGI